MSNATLTELERTLKKSPLPGKLLPDEQYRFHFHGEKCMGCSSCVVACNEQNSNEPDIRWRKVAEIEYGEFPHTGRFFLSMACNHCLEPSCMKGCPTNSYTRDPATGTIQHNQDTCVGCQYCTWNCPYGAPLYSPDLGIVTKCNMCKERLEEGRMPACAESCPVDAIEIEVINTKEWKENGSSKDAPGLPDSSITHSTTKITLPDKADLSHVRDFGKREVHEEHHHASLISFLLLSQLSVGTHAMLFLERIWNGLTGGGASMIAENIPVFTGTVLLSAFLSMFIALFHLGRPLRAFRALFGFAHSWISREIVFFTLFSAAAAVEGLYYLGLFGTSEQFHPAAGLPAFIFGMLGIYSSAKIYMVPARPIWNSISTIVRFFASAALLGPAVLLSILYFFSASSLEKTTEALLAAVVNFSLLQTAVLFNLTSFERRKKQPEVLEGIHLLKNKFSFVFAFRIFSLLLSGIAMPAFIHYALGFQEFASISPYLVYGIFTGLFLSEISGRYLFFVTSLPRKMAGGFSA